MTTREAVLTTREAVLRAVRRWPNNNCTRVLIMEQLSKYSVKAITSMLYKLEREGLIFKTPNPVGGWCCVNAKRIHSGWPSRLED